MRLHASLAAVLMFQLSGFAGLVTVAAQSQPAPESWGHLIEDPPMANLPRWSAKTPEEETFLAASGRFWDVFRYMQGAMPSATPRGTQLRTAWAKFYQASDEVDLRYQYLNAAFARLSKSEANDWQPLLVRASLGLENRRTGLIRREAYDLEHNVKSFLSRESLTAAPPPNWMTVMVALVAAAILANSGSQAETKPATGPGSCDRFEYWNALERACRWDTRQDCDKVPMLDFVNAMNCKP